MNNRGYQDLRVWKEAMVLAKDVYGVTKLFPKEEIYGLTQQIRRSAVSVASNIAEGSSRNTTGEFSQFLGIAYGSLAELKTQLLIACEVLVLPKDSLKLVLARVDDIGKMLHGLKKNIATRKQRTNNEQRATYVA